MRYLILALLLLFMVGCNEPDFRNVRWGMSREEVRQAESESLIDEYGELTCSLKVDDFPASLSYQFHNDCLYRAVYVFDSESVDSSIHHEVFKIISRILTKKYGHALHDSLFWSNDFYKADSSKINTALWLGHVWRYQYWRLRNTWIFHSILKTSRAFC